MIDSPKRLTQVAKEFNLGTNTILEFLAKKGHDLGNNPNAKVTPEMYALLEKEYSSEKSVKEASEKLSRETIKRQTVTMDDKKVEEEEDMDEIPFPTVIIKETLSSKPKEEKPVIKASADAVAGPKIIGKIDLDTVNKTKEKEELVVENKIEEKQPEVENVIEVKEEVIEVQQETEVVSPPVEPEIPEEESSPKLGVKVMGKIDLDSLNQKTHPGKKPKVKQQEKTVERPNTPVAKPHSESSKPFVENKEDKSDKPIIKKVLKTDSESTSDAPEIYRPEIKKLTGPKVLGTIELPSEKKIEKKKLPVASSSDDPDKHGKKKKKRKRIGKDVDEKRPLVVNDTDEKATINKKKKKKRDIKPELSEEDIQKQMKETLARLTDTTKSKAVKHRRQKREMISQKELEQQEKLDQERNVLKVTEFVSASELASMMSINVNQVISTCMSLGMFVSINQRLDAETIVIVAEEFGYTVEFVAAEVLEALKEDDIDENPNDYVERPPIVTVMGHVDHGKTSLLDYIRKTNVIAGEAGGITQHIGAYEVELANGKKITFLDTPGHEAFTAMRARGSKITDIAVIVVAADDSIMPQTREAINHAQAAGVPMIFAINKIDKPNANPEKIKEGLAAMNLLVEDWGGKFQSQDIAAKHGLNVEKLMDKIVLEAEMLELTGNPKRRAIGTVLEASLDKGKGYVAKILVQNGTLSIGDMVLAGTCYGKVKAMFNERNQQVKKAGPSTPVLLLGLNSAPQAGDSFTVMLDEREAKSIAAKREQLQREQGVRTQKHITLDEIGRRLAIGDFKELNIIVKGDVDGSVEALSDSLIKLSTEEIQVNIIHKSVGQVSESDVMLASASDAIIIAFQVRPSQGARKIAEQEQIDIRIYSVIYKAIDEVKAAMEGMLSPDVVETTVCSIEIREVFHISKVGSVAGCYMLDGKVTRNTPVRLIRDGIVIYSGKLGSLKRFKDDVKEVVKGFECGLNIDGFNDIRIGDIIEGYELTEVKRTL